MYCSKWTDDNKCSRRYYMSDDDNLFRAIFLLETLSHKQCTRMASRCSYMVKQKCTHMASC